MASPARMAGAGVLLLVLVAAVCAVLGGSSGVSATGLLQGQGASAAEATGLVFTAQDSRKIFKSMSHYEAGREAAFERKIEALRRESAREHDVHEHALAADEVKGEERVQALDARRLPAVFDSRDGEAQLTAAAKQAAAHEQNLQARISRYEQLDSAAHRKLETHLHADNAKSLAREANIAAHAEKQAAASVLKPMQQVQEQEDAVKYADAREHSFEARVSKYREASRHSVEKYEAAVAADEKAHAPRMHKLVQHALAHGETASGVENREEKSSSTARRSSKVAAAESKETEEEVRRLKMLEKNAVGAGTRDPMLGGVSGEQKAFKAEEQREVARQLDFKKRVEEESQKAAAEDRLRRKAAQDALHKMQVEAAARYAREEVKRADWKKKREERKAVQKVLASIRPAEWD